MIKLSELKSRWRNAMPQFFKRMMWICGLISGTALTINEALAKVNIDPPEWWMDIRPYLIAGSAGAMFACKFTQTYDKEGKPIQKGLEPSNPSTINESDVETNVN